MLLPPRRAAQLEQQWPEAAPSRGGRAALYRLPPPGENLSSPGTYRRVRPDTEGEEEEEEEDEEPEQVEPPTDEERTLVTAVLRAKDKLKQQIIRRRL
jgi:hypothetical protein